MGDETLAVVRRRPRLARTQWRGAADGPVVRLVRGARSPARRAGRRVARGDSKTFRGAERPGEGATLDGAARGRATLRRRARSGRIRFTVPLFQRENLQNFE
jgi:hypothetical protein